MAENRGTYIFRVPIRFDLQKVGCEWRVETDTDGNVVFHARPELWRPKRERFTEGWDLVRRFLSVDTRSKLAILDFLTDTGIFGTPRLAPQKHDYPLPPMPAFSQFEDSISIEYFRDIQDYVRRMLLNGDATLPPPWTGGRIQNYVVEFKSSRFGPQAEVSIDGARPAIFALVQFKLVQGATFKACARKDCRLPFEVTSRHKRRFCCQYCAHITSLRHRRKTLKQSNHRGEKR